MLSTTFLASLRAARVSAVATRTLVSYSKATDPIQQLFLDKIREYKKKSPDGKLVDPSPEIQTELKRELAKLERNYGGAEGTNMTEFPKFTFEEPKLDPIDEQESKAAKK